MRRNDFLLAVYLDGKGRENRTPAEEQWLEDYQRGEPNTVDAMKAASRGHEIAKLSKRIHRLKMRNRELKDEAGVLQGQVDSQRNHIRALSALLENRAERIKRLIRTIANFRSVYGESSASQPGSTGLQGTEDSQAADVRPDVTERADGAEESYPAPVHHRQAPGDGPSSGSPSEGA